MLRLVLLSFSVVLVVTPGLINADVECKGVIQDGKLKIIQKIEESTDSTPAPTLSEIPEDCTDLEIRAGNETEINWDTVEKIRLPKLKIFKLYLTFENPEARKDFEFKTNSLFGNELKEITRLGTDFYLYINDNLAFNYDAPLKYLSIYSIYTNPILKAFEGQDIKLTTLILEDPKFDGVDLNGLDSATTLTLKNVASSENISAFIQKFKSVENLSLSQINETIDIGQILHSKKLNSLDITNAALTYTESNSVQSETLKTLTLTDCTLDESFKENAWKVMPNLTTFRYSSSGKIDIKDLLVHKQLAEISLTNANLSFTKPTEQYKTLKTLKLDSCEFDLTHFAEFASSTFPNMTYLSVDATSGGTKPTSEFLNDVLDKFPEIQRISIDPFDFSPSKGKGTFDIIYTVNVKSISGTLLRLRNPPSAD